MDSEQYEFRTAQFEDYNSVLNCLRENFIHEEAINQAYPAKDFKKDEEFFMSLLFEENILLAINKADKTLAGFVAMEIINGNTLCDLSVEAEETKDPIWADILKFLYYIESKADVIKRCNVAESLHIHGVSVDKKHRGKGLGTKLFEKPFEVARKRGLKLVSVECTSVSSSNIARRVGMDLISTVTYDEYHDKIGMKIFSPIPPNFEIKTFVKFIS